MGFKKFNKFKKSDKDFQGKSLVMPNRKVLEDKYSNFIQQRNIYLDKTDVFNYSFMEQDFRVYVSTNLRNSFLVNISTLKGKMIHSDIIDIKGTTKNAADKVFYSIFREERV